MADYRLSAQAISRSDGRTAIAAAAYRSGQLLADERTGRVHDYTRKGGVMHEEIMAPDNAPAWAKDREALWNAVEVSERQKNSQLAREIQLSLPHELSHEQRVALVREFVQENFVAQGMVADIAVHAPSRYGDQRNFHAHVMLTMREIGPDGFSATKRRDWNSRELLADWRANWAKTQNQHLAQAIGKDAPTVTDKSYRERGIDKVPGAHLGPEAAAIERRRETSRRGDFHRERASMNDRMKDARRHQDILHAQLNPSTPRTATDIALDLRYVRKELNELKEKHEKELETVLADMKGKRLYTVGAIEKLALDPFEKEEKKATRDLDMARQRAGIDASPKQIMQWFRNPASALWQQTKRSIEVDLAATKLRQAQQAKVQAQTWLKSEPGMKFTAGKYAEINADLKRLRTAERRARRNIAQTTRNLATANRLAPIATALSNNSLGRGIPAPSRNIDTTRYLNTVQNSLQTTVRALTPQQRQAVQQSINLVLGIGRGISR